MSKLRHIVLFKIHDSVADDVFEKALNGLKDLGLGHEGLEAWEVNVSSDTRKGRIIVEEAVFSSEADFERFRVSDKHTRAGELMRTISDWWVGDYALD